MTVKELTTILQAVYQETLSKITQSSNETYPWRIIQQATKLEYIFVLISNIDSSFKEVNVEFQITEKEVRMAVEKSLDVAEKIYDNHIMGGLGNSFQIKLASRILKHNV